MVIKNANTETFGTLVNTQQEDSEHMERMSPILVRVSGAGRRGERFSSDCWGESGDLVAVWGLISVFIVLLLLVVIGGIALAAILAKKQGITGV